MYEYTVADLFCGAGGSSTGAAKAVAEIGGRMELVAVNHWPLAVATHQQNHPQARHYVQDLDGADPQAIVPEGRLDLLMASPECRYWSRASGGKPKQDQGRMNPWIVQRWLTAIDVHCLLVENVPEFVNWGPLDENNKPIRKYRGWYFNEWIRSLWGLGYDVQWRMLNAADYGEATTRTRFFLVARKDGVPVRLAGADPRESQRRFARRPAQRGAGLKEMIDWSRPGPLVAGRSEIPQAKPLAEKTRSSGSAKGLERFAGPLAPRYIALLGLSEEVTRGDGGAGDVAPFVLNRPWGKRCYGRVRSTVTAPLPSATTRGAGYRWSVRWRNPSFARTATIVALTVSMNRFRRSRRPLAAARFWSPRSSRNSAAGAATAALTRRCPPSPRTAITTRWSTRC